MASAWAICSAARLQRTALVAFARGVLSVSAWEIAGTRDSSTFTVSPNVLHNNVQYKCRSYSQSYTRRHLCALFWTEMSRELPAIVLAVESRFGVYSSTRRPTPSCHFVWAWAGQAGSRRRRRPRRQGRDGYPDVPRMCAQIVPICATLSVFELSCTHHELARLAPAEQHGSGPVVDGLSRATQSALSVRASEGCRPHD